MPVVFYLLAPAALLLLCSNIAVVLDYEHGERLLVSLRLAGLLRIRLPGRLARRAGTVADQAMAGRVWKARDCYQLLCYARPRISQMRRAGLYFADKSRWRVLDFYLAFNMNDAALTAVAAGYGWTLIGLLQALLLRRLHFDSGQPAIVIRPQFSGQPTVLVLRAHFRLRVYHMLVFMIIVLKTLLPSRRELVRWKATRSRA